MQNQYRPMLGRHGLCAVRVFYCATPVVKLSFGHLLRQARVAADLISSYEINIIFYAWITNNMHSKRHTMNIFHISYNMFTFLFVLFFAVDKDNIQHYFPRCHRVFKNKMRERYLEVLRNATGFRSLCDDYSDLCKPENVDVDC